MSVCVTSSCKWHMGALGPVGAAPHPHRSQPDHFSMDDTRDVYLHTLFSAEHWERFSQD